MNYGTIYQFLDIARKCQSFAEFKLETVFHGKARLGTQEVFDDDIEPLIYDINAVDDTFANIDHCRVTDYLRSQLYNIPWLNDYLNSFIPQKELYDDIGAFDPTLSFLTK